jgi:hypothetical protein
VLVFAYVLRVDVVKPWLVALTVATLTLSFLGYVRDAVGFVRRGAARAA